MAETDETSTQSGTQSELDPASRTPNPPVPEVKVEPNDDEPIIIHPSLPNEQGSSVNNAIVLEDDDDNGSNAILLEDGNDNGSDGNGNGQQVEVKSEPDSQELPESAYRMLGHAISSAIILDADDVHDEPPQPMLPVPGPSTNPDTQPSLSTPHSSEAQTTPARRSTRLNKEKLRHAMKILRERDNGGSVRQAPPSNPALNPQPSSPLAEVDENKRAAAAFAQAKAAYEAKKATNQCAFADDVAFYKLDAEESARLMRVEENARFVDDDAGRDISGPFVQDDSDSDGLFVRSSSRPRKKVWPGQDRMDEDEENFIFGNDEGPSAGPSKGGGSLRTPELEDELRAGLENLNQGKKKRKRSNKSNDSRKRSKKGEGKSSKKDKKGKARATDENTNRLLDVGSMFTANVWRDAAANADAADLPDVTETRKTEALKKLIASVPREHKKIATMDKKELYAASGKFSRGSVRVDGQGGWKVAGMNTSLKNYQMTGAAFMRERERGPDLPLGGICADAMGLGKTLLMIANIVDSKRVIEKLPAEQQGPKPTLVVVPSSLVAQWESELKKHISNKLKFGVCRYTAGSRIETNDTPETLSTFDVVVTTYYEVQSSYPKTELPLHLQTSEDKKNWWRGYYEEHKGVLHRVEWRRIVLDEAQIIKNHKSKTSLGCRALKSKYKWALSGTPILNSPLELYAYFKFLQVPYTGSFRVFKNNYYGENSEEPLERLQLMVNKFMIRRTHRDTMFGAPILKLPKASERIHWVKFNELERAIYDIVHRRMVARVNSMSSENNLQRNYSNILTMLLRLRQLTGNVLLVEVVMKDLLEREDHEKIHKLAQIEIEGDEQRRLQLIQLRKTLAAPPIDAQNASTKNEGTHAEQDESSSARARVLDLPDDQVSIGDQHGLKFNFGKYLADLRKGKSWEELQERTLCMICKQPPTNPFVTSCYHLFCEECLEKHVEESALKGHNRTRCKQCSVEYSWAERCDEFTLDSIISSDNEDNAESPPVDRWRKKTDDAAAVKTWIESMPGKVLPSAKTIAIKAQILNWTEEDPGCKIIIYTQFLAMIHILRKMCDTEGWTCQEFHGKMSVATRDKAIEEFKKNDVSILLASLRSGGVGLNITAAKHVISVDPWWNSSVEQQAFCRVFRIGQTSETSMTRFVVEGTIDEAMIQMQERKQAEIDHIMGDSGHVRDKLSLPEMLRLFGPVRDDDRGRPFVFVEDKETLPRWNADSDDEGDED